MLNIEKFSALLRGHVRFHRPHADSDKERRYWRRRKQALRRNISIICSSIIIIAIELSTPDYGFTDIIYTELVQRVSLLETALSWLNEWLQLDPKDSKPGLKISLIIFFLLILIYVLSYALQHSDPFDNNEGLFSREGAFYESDRVPPGRSWNKELTYYALNRPSSFLGLTYCEKCTHQDYCKNALGAADRRSFRIWWATYECLDSDLVAELADASLACRRTFYLKYGLLLCAISCIFIYFTARIVEFLAIRDIIELPQISQIQGNFGLIFYFLILVCLYCVLSRVSRISSNFQPSGVWSGLKDNSQFVVEKDAFCEVFSNIGCRYEGNHFKFSQVGAQVHDQTEKLYLLLEYLSEVSKSRGMYSVVTKGELRKLDRIIFEKILLKVAEFYFKTSDRGLFIRTAVFGPTGGGEKLSSVMEQTVGENNLHSHERNSTRNWDPIDTKSSDCVVARAFNEEIVVDSTALTSEPVYRDGLTTGSVLAYPLIFDSEYLKVFGDSNLDVPSRYGVLYLESTSARTFSEENRRLNQTIVRQFADRFLIEAAVRLSLEGD